MIVKNTRWGKPFFGCSRYPDCDWASWGKPDPTLTLTKEDWERIKAERKEKSEKRRATMEARYGKKPTKVAKTPAKKKTVKKRKTKK